MLFLSQFLLQLVWVRCNNGIIQELKRRPFYPLVFIRLNFWSCCTRGQWSFIPKWVTKFIWPATKHIKTLSKLALWFQWSLNCRSLRSHGNRFNLLSKHACWNLSCRSEFLIRVYFPLLDWEFSWCLWLFLNYFLYRLNNRWEKLKWWDVAVPSNWNYAKCEHQCVFAYL